MEFIDKSLLEYCEIHTEEESGLLSDLNRQTHLKIQSPRMLSGHLQGRFLAMLSKMIHPHRILEIGTYTGYSALCLAEGLDQNGRLFTIDSNEETNAFAATFFDRSAYKENIIICYGNAAEIIPTLHDTFDLVFIDADKKNYSLYYDLVIDKIGSGGLILADNVLWSGKILDEKKDADTQAIHAFNQKIAADKRVEKVLLPLRDGLTLIRKN